MKTFFVYEGAKLMPSIFHQFFNIEQITRVSHFLGLKKCFFCSSKIVMNLEMPVVGSTREYQIVIQI